MLKGLILNQFPRCWYYFATVFLAKIEEIDMNLIGCVSVSHCFRSESSTSTNQI